LKKECEGKFHIDVQLVMNKNLEGTCYKRTWLLTEVPYNTYSIDHLTFPREELKQMIEKLEYKNGELDCDVLELK
jgi:hypothetical protein